MGQSDMDNGAKDLLPFVGEMERLLMKRSLARNKERMLRLANEVARIAPNEGIAELVGRLKTRIEQMGKRMPGGLITRDRVRDVVWRLRVSLEALSRDDPTLH